MDAIRTHRLLARIVLAWFVLFIGASVASPLIKPSAAQLICSASGAMKLVSAGGGDGNDTSSTGVATMDCPLCVPVALALPTPESTLHLPSSLAYAWRPTVAAHLVWVTRSSLPARGPPAFS